ncbi:MAG: short-chain dehydrogenase/reductase, partial [Mycobacterium sp.]
RFEVKKFGVDVVIIQPGLIRTEFAATAAHEIDAPSATGGPYAAFNAAVGATTEEVYGKGPLAKLGGGPDTVAKAVQKAIAAKHPPVRIRVTPSAHVLIGTRGLMSDRMWDRFLATQFPRPGAKSGV